MFTGSKADGVILLVCLETRVVLRDFGGLFEGEDGMGAGGWG